MSIIYWFRRDRRLSDNPALVTAIDQAKRESKALLPVTLLKPDQSTEWGFAREGPHRRAYEAQSLSCLSDALTQLGSRLYQPDTAGINGLIELATHLGATCIVCEAIGAPDELAQVKALKSAGFTVKTVEQSALLPDDELPFDPSHTPTVFSEFRRHVERAKSRPRVPLSAPLNAPAHMPELPLDIPGAHPYQPTSLADTPPLDTRSALPYQTDQWHGGHRAGLNHVETYFGGDLPRHYKTSRNGLIGTSYSTKFSPWLATGAVSAAQIVAALEQHEARHGSNDGTYWIWFELLWRDHFRLMMRRFGSSLFKRTGLSKTAHTAEVARSHNKQGFDRWRHGLTGHDFIDAGMRELSATGYLSNRMRQNVASYLIHDLGADWRAGAAWFEHCLVDFDVHSNQGNWAYIAGVGTDPRGGRRFNPDKQANDYDRSAAYRQCWSHQ